MASNDGEMGGLRVFKIPGLKIGKYHNSYARSVDKRVKSGLRAVEAGNIQKRKDKNCKKASADTSYKSGAL